MDYTDDSQLPDVSDATFGEAVKSIRDYTLLVLKPGPKYGVSTDRDPEIAAAVFQHAKRNYSLRLAGLLPVVGPVAGGDIAGIGIFEADSQTVERIMAGDPGVKAGVFTYELHELSTFPGSALAE